MSTRLRPRVYQIRLRSGAVGSGIPSPAGSTAGDVLVRGASAWQRVAIGTNGQVLSVVGGAVAWAAGGGGGGGGISDGDKGDVTVSSSGTVWTVDAIGGVAAARVARTDAGWSNAAGVYSHSYSLGGALTQAGGDGVLVVEAGGTSIDVLSVGSTGSSLLGSASASAARTILDTATEIATALTGYLTSAAAALAYQPLATILSAIASLGVSGLVARTGAGTVAARSVVAPAAGITVTNGDGIAGSPTLALADDLAALEGLASTGIARRTASNTWTVGDPVATSEVTALHGFTKRRIVSLG